MTTTAWAAVILAGGGARRLGGVDKPALVVGGRSLLDRAIAAATGASQIVVVGPARPTAAEVSWARESPPGGGPVAAIKAGLAVLDTGAEIVVVLAADLPLISPDIVSRLVVKLARRHDADAVAAASEDGRVQPLVAAYRRAPLARALRDLGDVSDRPVREVLARLAVDVLVDDAAACDIDTPDDLRRWRSAPSA